jgi:hypothetical protein
MPTSAMISSIEVAENPFASTADSATARMRSRVSSTFPASPRSHC